MTKQFKGQSAQYFRDYSAASAVARRGIIAKHKKEYDDVLAEEMHRRGYADFIPHSVRKQNSEAERKRAAERRQAQKALNKILRQFPDLAEAIRSVPTPTSVPTPLPLAS